MQESELKTSWKQRIFIAIIAALLLGASVAIYVMIIMNGGKTSTSDLENKVSDERIAELQSIYTEKQGVLDELANGLSDKYFEKFSKYKSNIKSFNANSANEDGLKTEDLKKGSGDKLAVDATGYAAYYVGWCSDETIFDSSFDDKDNPKSLKAPLVVEESSLIEGWYQGVAGMHLGGVRIVTIPGELAYGDSYNPCDQSSEEKNVPLKFMIMPVEVSDEFSKASKEATEAQQNYMYAAYYGIDMGSTD